MTHLFQNISLAAAGGIIPALIWLLFWLREDRKHPEPTRLLFLTFAAGMIVVLPVLKLEAIVWHNVSDESLRLIYWSLIEELAKFLAALTVVLWRKEVDEPIDYVVYLVATALGFAAVENTLFALNPLSAGLFVKSLQTLDVRFIGATLLHITASSAVGISMALAFYKNLRHKARYLLFGLILASALHAAFNLIIISDSVNQLLASAVVWVGVLCILLMLEKVKKLHPTKD